MLCEVTGQCERMKRYSANINETVYITVAAMAEYSCRATRCLAILWNWWAFYCHVDHHRLSLPLLTNKHDLSSCGIFHRWSTWLQPLIGQRSTAYRRCMLHYSLNWKQGSTHMRTRPQQYGHARTMTRHDSDDNLWPRRAVRYRLWLTNLRITHTHRYTKGRFILQKHIPRN